MVVRGGPNSELVTWGGAGELGQRGTNLPNFVTSLLGFYVRFFGV